MAQQIEQLLNDVGFKIGTLREARNLFSAQLAPEFRLFDYLKADEMGLSTCMADLLDPKGKHGQGSVFLDVFLESIGIEESLASNTEGCRVHTEKQANGQRRLDIFLELPNGVIGIENKPWAGCQDNQLLDYADYLEKYSHDKDWRLVFLSNHDPEEKSLNPVKREQLEKNGQYVQLNYSEVINWLNICSCKSRAPVVRMFIEELVTFIREKINGEIEMSYEKDITKEILKSTKSLDAAFQVAKTMKNVKEDLLKKLHEDLDSSVKKQQGLILVDWGIDGWGKFEGFNIEFFNNEQKLHLRFQFENTNLNLFFWGIAWTSDDYYSAHVWEEVKKLMDSELYLGKSAKRWPWYSDLPDHEFNAEMINWSHSETPWIMIMNGEMARIIIDLSVRVRAAFNRNNKLSLLCEE